jgi:2-methylcitrate dehydratase PrpD
VGSRRPLGTSHLTRSGPDLAAGSTLPLARLAAFVTGLRETEPPPEVLEAAKAHLLYNLACGMAADPVADVACDLIAGLAPPEATLIGHDRRAPCEAAAFANGVILHSRAQDDTHFASQCHPGAAIAPAALALLEQQRSTGDALLLALVAGYEVAAAVGEPLVEPLVERGFRAASVFGTLGAAAAAASALSLDGHRTADALAISASFAGGLTETWLAGSSEWLWQLGTAARNGVVAARLASAGASGAASALEGPGGFAKAFAGVDGWEPPTNWELGERWRTLEVIYKPYPVCNIAQAPVLLASQIAKRLDLHPELVASIRCHLHPFDYAYPGTLNRGPFANVAATLMSVYFAIASALEHGTVTTASLREFDDPVIARLIRRTEVVPHADLPPLAARLEVETADGRVQREELFPDEKTFGSGWEDAVAAAERMRPEMGPRACRLDSLREAIEELDDLDVSAVVSMTASP